MILSEIARSACVATAWPMPWAQIVMAHQIALRASKGHFSISKGHQEGQFIARTRSKGQKSRSNNRNGRVTAIGFDIRARAKRIITVKRGPKNLRDDGFCAVNAST